MEAKITATINSDETKIVIALGFSGRGCDDAFLLKKQAEKYAKDAAEIGMKYDRGTFTAEIEASDEACIPFLLFADKFGLNIVQI